MNLLDTSGNVRESRISDVPQEVFLVDSLQSLSNICPLNTGKVYTPTFLANWVAESLLNYVKKNNIMAIDPACGEGELLLALKNNTARNVRCIGMDIDAEATQKAQLSLGTNSTFQVIDSLIPSGGESYKKAWKKLIKGRKVDALIANPPWGADLAHARESLIRTGYDLAKGQFDSWDLFVELSLSIVKSGGHIAFILPDAIFLPEHENLRKLLNEKTTILLIARLGEGFFKNVYRGTTIVILKNEPSKPNHKTEVLRLNKDIRSSILRSETSLNDARKKLKHSIPQKRFTQDEHASWDIDFREKESQRVQTVFSMYRNWTSLFESGRGVELSKLGKVILCPKCEYALPTPRAPKKVSCENCGHTYHSANAEHCSIISDRGKSKKVWADFIAGEDVCRYEAQPSRAIKRFVSGINYKDEDTYKKRRLLVRKTGLGINATIVSDEAYTNQVVFHYFEKEKLGVPDFYLSYVLGVLNSRVMFAYHLAKNGENEWRSHPYITQKILARFPIPSLNEEGFSQKQAQAIAKKVDLLLDRKYKNRQKLELEIECLVAGLYKLTTTDIEWVRNVIESAQELAPMRQMKEIDLSEINTVYA